MVEHLNDSSVKLKRIFIESRLPEELEPMQEMANNLCWSWSQDATELFKQISPENWEALNYNPIAILDQLGVERAQELLKDKSFMSLMSKAHESFKKYLGEKPADKSPKIAYFSMEFGLHISARLYSGGLGVLAGDFLKEASDENVNMAGVGLLYRYGYFEQSISLYGDQVNNYTPQEYTKMPMHPVRDKNGEWLKITIDMPGRQVFAKVWALPVGRIPLYLLDTDLNENSWEDRSITHHLYGGDKEHRLKQEMFLGIGGIRALEALGFEADIYHCNEGHAAFMGLERMRGLIRNQHLTYPQAKEVVRSSSLFTTHTPVPAGHDYFTDELLRKYMTEYCSQLGITWYDFMALGRIDAANNEEPFSMSHLAIHLCQEVNGVSELHGLVSQQMFKTMFPGYNQQELHVGFVTNGVHYPTWIANDWHKLFQEYAGDKFIKNQADLKNWEGIQKIPSNRIMEIRKMLKNRLLHYVKDKMKTELTRRGEKPGRIFEVLNNIPENALVIGFARRFATYKRAHLLFQNPERLAQLVGDKQRPVMFIFAGKAHPADQPGQKLIKDIVNISKRPEFAGKVIFLEGYNMEMARLLVQGVDIWLNTPTRPLEASGTSGMKAAMNGVMNFSVLDGWWAEGYRPDSGWALPLENTYDDPVLQDELDAETLYNTFEEDIIPTYYKLNAEGISEDWVQYIRNVISKVGPRFTMKRMMDDYFSRYYNKLAKRGGQLKQDHFKDAKVMADWKKQMQQRWSGIHLVDRDIFDTDNYSLTLGESFKVGVKVYCNGVKPEHLGIEVLFFKRKSDTELELRNTYPLSLTHGTGDIATFESEINPQMSGVYEYGFRLYPKHESLPHRQDLSLIKWL
jgi:alpha-glucan phosphorylase-like protein